jgi:hypothetical protein
MPVNDKSSRYSRKITLLAGSAAILALVYLITLFYDPERVAARNAAFTWLPGEARDLADRIEITRPGEKKFVLIRKNGSWFAELGAGQVPVKQGRVDDLFRILTGRGTFPRLGSSASSHAALGLSPEQAIRLVVWGGAAVQPLLDLLVGADDAAGRDVYLRKNGDNEYRSGDRLIKTYADGEARAWYDLRLFDESRAGLVQRVKISPLKDGEGDEDFTLVKSGQGWSFEGYSGAPPADTVDTWLRNLFDIQGDDFISREDSGGFVFNAAAINIELGNGSVITVQAAQENAEKWPVTVSGSPYVYLLSRPTFRRLFQERSAFVQP